MRYFFDSYAIIEIIKGNPDYQIYSCSQIILSLLNIIELNYILLKNNAGLSRELSIKYSKYIVPITLRDIEEANRFRLENKKNKLSTADTIGYVLALKHNVKFLTGDEGFRNFPNVEFRK